MSVAPRQSNNSFCCLSLRTGAVAIIGYYTFTSLLNVLLHCYYEPSNFFVSFSAFLYFSNSNFGALIILAVCVTGLIGCYQRSHMWMNMSSKAYFSYAFLWSMYTSVLSGAKFTDSFIGRNKMDFKEAVILTNSTETFESNPEEMEAMYNIMTKVVLFTYFFSKLFVHLTRFYFAYVLHRYTCFLRPKLDILQREEKTITPQ